jgi:flavin-dependent dehydrogenase
MTEPHLPGDRAASDASQAPASTTIETDVLVIGGGPAGTTAAAFLARKGWKVLLLEKDRHPRFHIGESLLPMNLPILQRLGVLEQVAAIGLYKAGADFPTPGKSGSEDYNTFRFARALDPKFPHAYQVHRAEFDQLLFKHARDSGVDAREGVKVERVDFGPDNRPAAAHARDATGAGLEVRMRYVVDASGRDTFFGNRFKLKRKNPHHQSAAIFSHFDGVSRRPGDDSGNITVQRFAHGWMWLIPLPRGVMSIGAVCFPSYLKQRRGENDGFFMNTLLAEPQVAARMQGATRVAPVHVTGNYAYSCTKMYGSGWVMAGDAYAFVDPIFSSGVYLAMDGAEQAANVVDGALREPAREAALQAAMARRMDRGLRWFTWFIYRFNTPVMKHLFANPRNAWQVEQAVISMLAGDVFDNPAVIRRLRVFRVIYALTALTRVPAAMRGWLRQRRAAREDFSGDTLQQESP